MSSNNYLSPVSSFIYNYISFPVFKSGKAIYNFASDHISYGNMAGIAVGLYNPNVYVTTAISYVTMAKSSSKSYEETNFYDQFANSYMLSSLASNAVNMALLYKKAECDFSFTYPVIKALAKTFIPIVTTNMLQSFCQNNVNRYYDHSKSLTDNIEEHHRKYHSNNNAHYNQQEDIKLYNDSNMFKDL